MGIDDPVRLRLVAAKIRPSALAGILGVTPQAASQMLSGRRGIPRKHLQRIATMLGLSVATLLSSPRDLPDQSTGIQPAYARKGGIRDDKPGGSTASLSNSEVSAILLAILRAKKELATIERTLTGDVGTDVVPDESEMAPDSDRDARGARRKRTQK